VNHPFFYEVSLRWMVLLPALLILPGLRAQAPAKSLNELKGFFAANCVKCHGPDGSAHTLEGKKLGGFDFTDAVKAAKESDADMVKTVRKGIFFGLVMPSFKDRLTDDDIQLLVKEVLRKAEKGKVIAPSS
jgi:mono/diheme cytochrome c family protein